MAKGFWNSAKSLVGDAASSVGNTLDDVVDYGSNAANAAISTATDVASNAGSYLDELMDVEGESVGTLPTIGGLGGLLRELLDGSGEKVPMEPVSVPFQDMTQEQIDRQNYDRQTAEANRNHEAALERWRVAQQRYNDDPVNNPSPGDRPTLQLPPPVF